MGTDFERVRRAMFREEGLDRVPLFEMSVHADLKASILGGAVRTLEDEVAFWCTAGYDFVSIRAGVRSIVRGHHPVVKQWQRARRGEAGNPGTSGWVVEGEALIRDRRDLQDFPWPAPEDLGGYSDYGAMDVYLATMQLRLPSDMKLLVQLGYLFMGAWQLMGFNNFMFQLADDPAFVQEVIDRLGASQLAVLEILLQYGCVGTIWLPDDLCYNSGPVVSPRTYGKYVYPWYVRIVARCHEAGMPVGFHSDGDLTRLLPDLVACGFDCIHPFEPPLNDIVAVKRAWGHRISVAGNIDLRGPLSRGTPGEVEAEVREKAAALAPGGGWLLGSSNSIPDFVPVENYKALLTAGLKYGRYDKP